MATARRAIPKSTSSSVIPITKVSIPKKEPEVSFRIRTDIDGSNNATVYIGNDTVFEFEFSSGDVPYCCGLRELGSFEIVEEERHKLLTREVKVSAIRQLLEQIMAEATNSSGRCTTLLFTLVKDECCNLVRDAIKDQNLFTRVKTFINENSGNTNELFVSNN